MSGLNKGEGRAMDLMSVSEMTMSSLEIAELTGKRHDNILADIRKMLAEIQSPEKLGDYQDGLGRTYPMLLLDKEEALCLVSGYNIKMRMAIIKRWQQLEMENRPQLPNFNNAAEAARAWADQYEQNQKLAIDLNHAVATKAEIGSRREATAMATASIATRKANKLQKELDQSQEYATVKRMEMIHHGIKFNWRNLKKASEDLGLPPIDVFDQNYGTVKGWHSRAWKKAYALGFERLEA